MPITERTPTNPGITDAQQLGLLTAALSALVVEIRADRVERKRAPSLHLLMATSGAVGASIAIAVLMLAGAVARPLTVTTTYVPPIGQVSRGTP